MSQFTSAGSPGTDHHCGWSYIAVGQTVIIVENKQMVCFGTFVCDGDLIIDGTLILET
jgi:hypothetical protein